MLNSILGDALKKGASDIHITSMCEVYLRINGRLIADMSRRYTVEELEEMAKEIAQEKYNVLLEDRQLDIAYSIPGMSRFRVNMYFQRGTLSITLRTIKSEPPTLEELRLPPIFRELTQHKNGLLLVTGATGSGKSTTMAALVNEINITQEKKIVTLEDPIEFIFSNKKSLITQRELGTDVHNFADGLKSMLRQDPDIILVGELRDLETVSMALTAAETGHLVIATLHTNSAISSIERIISVYPAEQIEQVKLQLSKSLRAIITQNLVPTKLGGRTAALEILLNTTGISNLIRENKLTQIPNMIKMGRSEGMVLMGDYLDTLVLRGIITPEVSESFKNN